MARYTVSHPTVRSLIDDMLVPGYIALGNTAALARGLNDVLARLGEQGRIHVNRVHALLSEDVARGVNQSSVDLLQKALQANPWLLEANSETLSELRNRAMPQFGTGLQLNDVAELVGVPPAVLARAMRDAEVPDPRLPIASDGPDWGFQNVAVERCMDAMRRRPAVNVGLVLPTGAGKTRTALRVILEKLAADTDPHARAIWITHRLNLRSQAFRELGKLLDQQPLGLPDDAAALADRIDFGMLSDAPTLLARCRPAIVVVDEAHHSAARTYRDIFEKTSPYPVLLLTATPVRMDQKPIFIDEIAFTITYRELAERHAIIVPEFEPLRVASFDLADPEVVKQIAARIVDETANRFRKTLVIASRIEHVEALYDRVIEMLDGRTDHPIDPSDVGYLHGLGNSHRMGQEALLALFAEKPRAILVSAQMLLEGFDDPAIDSVVVTYRTESVTKLMQAAGRCVRHSPGKRQAWVLQVDNPALSYRFDQRWLYEDISDRPRPVLIDLEYADRSELESGFAELMARHHVDEDNVRRVMKGLADVDVDEEPRLMLYGLPYFGRASRFELAPWGAFLETKGNTDTFRALFNRYCSIPNEHPDAREFVDAAGPGFGLPAEATRLRRELIEVIGALMFALDETADREEPSHGSRNYGKNGATTFLRYAISHYRGRIPHALEEFLADCHNGTAIAAAYSQDADGSALAIKVPLPIGGYEGRLLPADDAGTFIRWLDTIADVLRAVEPSRQFARLTALRSELPSPPVPPIHLDRTESMISEAGRRRLTLDLTELQEPRR